MGTYLAGVPEGLGVHVYGQPLLGRRSRSHGGAFAWANLSACTTICSGTRFLCDLEGAVWDADGQTVPNLPRVAKL